MGCNLLIIPKPEWSGDFGDGFPYETTFLGDLGLDVPGRKLVNG